MNPKAKYFAGSLIAALAVILIWRHFQNERSSINSSVNNSANGKKAASTSAPAAAKPSASSNAAVKEVVQSLFDNLKKMSALQEVPPIQKQIQDAIDSKDTGKIIRAFHEAVYDQDSKMSEAIPALKSFLDDSDPWIRFQAAEDLYIAGDNSGSNALISILQTGHPIRDFDGSDLRIQVAKLLEKYREKRAINALEEFCRNIGDLSIKNSGLEILDGLALIAGNSLPDDLVKIIQNKNDSIYVNYNLSFVNPQSVEDFAQATFSKSKDGSQAKAYAAWALLKAGERAPYYSYLMGFAQKAITGTTSLTKQTDQLALKILASIKDPESKAMLEGALDSTKVPVVKIALVNLIFNQGGSDKVKQFILNELNQTSSRLNDWDFTMKIAVLLNDPKINAAGQAFENRHEEASWSYYEDRKNWSVYTWIDDYVVDLNGSRQIP